MVDFELFLRYITTSPVDEAPAEIRKRRIERTGHRKRSI